MRLRRLGHEKSKNGCLTCKTRRIKCDENRPWCRNCTLSGRKCEGPLEPSLRFIQDQTWDSISFRRSRPPLSAFVTGNRSSSSANFEKPPISLHAEFSLAKPARAADERRAFAHFIHRAGPCFAGAIDAKFWNVLVPRLAQTEPLVWDLVISMSHLFEQVPFEGLVTSYVPNETPDAQTPAHRQALTWYNRAISTLRTRINTSEIDDVFALVSCILCTSVEFQQRNVGNALHLMTSGYRIFTQSLTTTKQYARCSDTLELADTIIPFVSRHVVLMAAIGIITMPRKTSYNHMNPFQPPTTPVLQIIYESRSQLYQTLFQAYEVIRVAWLMWHDLDVIDALSAKQAWWLREMEKWHVNFGCQSWKTADSEVKQAMDYLAICWNVCYICLATCLSTEQLPFDRYIDHFSRILQLAEQYIEAGRQETLSTVPQTAITPALYFTGIRCRDPALRRKALWLLRRAPRDEGLWGAISTVSVVEHVISTEEGINVAELSNCNMDDDWNQNKICMPPEHQRFHYTAVTVQKNSNAKLEVMLQLGRIGLEENGQRGVVYRMISLGECY
ncbi:hypothetical protein PV10_06879 [Exophiala mesophila]|uniref:Zn(2)-C6 fungal-type domain-containing protein n=1 Tax=Exophiala mesophila TaxID=212818 RepID=A0A0D1Z6H9_EXOME|nr:uncharacterized protein PV10_06879 [Exophiala mesophila]KIV89484.1 hypothetical protein PV10_06879 [Exophiala mesophila]